MSEICGDRQAFCVCSAIGEHEVHGCFGRDNCKGTWMYDDKGEVIYLTNPLTGQTIDEWLSRY